MPAAMTTGGVQLFGEGPMWLARLQARVVMLLPMAASMLLRRLLPFLQWPPMLTMFSKVANPDKTFSQARRLGGAGHLRNSRVQGRLPKAAEPGRHG